MFIMLCELVGFCVYNFCPDLDSDYDRCNFLQVIC